MKYSNIYNKLKKILSSKKEVLAIFNNGSSVVGLDTPGSDLDFFF